MARTLDDAFAAVDAMDVDGFLAGLSTDVVLTFDNAPSATGHDQARAACTQLWSTKTAPGTACRTCGTRNPM